MRTSCVKNGLVMVVILLLVGVAIQPSIATVQPEEETVEFTTEVCGLNGGKHTVKLTQEEAEGVEALFKSIRERLNNTETREDAEEIFKEVVVELEKYGLLGGLSVKQAQELVLGDFPVDNNHKILGIGPNFFTNIFCLLAGTAYGGDSYSYCFPFGLSFLLIFPLYVWSMSHGKIFLRVIIALQFFDFINPLKFFNIIVSINFDWDISTLGLKGLIDKLDEADFFSLLGFTGLMISPLDELPDKFHFLGFCLGIYSSSNISSEVV